MSKNENRGYSVLIILFVLFNVVSFVIPFSKNSSFFVAYIFGIIAILFQIYIIKMYLVKGKKVKSRFYGFPIVQIGVVYLFVQILLSIIEMIIANMLASWLAIVINILSLSLALVGCITADVMKDEIQRQDEELSKKISNMRELQTVSENLVKICTDNAGKEHVKRVADAFKYSDPVSSEQTEDIEHNLKILLEELQNGIMDKDNELVKELCEEINAKLSERNRICILNK